jgi:peptide-methionine (R)-S-oxide reductase|tara:strand:- start:542 stop:1048 length:507 start_codon:yes stop_codon:yes gene_type:complete
MKLSSQILLIIITTAFGVLFVNFTSQDTYPKLINSTKKMKDYKVKKSDEEWKKILSDEEYRVLINKGTEYPGTGEYNIHMKEGIYNCKGCDNPLFTSDQKFESNCGWPSFDNAIEGSVEYKNDYTLGMTRVEILCTNCGGHLGHVFNDGPTESGKRYCVNSVSIDFKN